MLLGVKASIQGVSMLCIQCYRHMQDAPRQENMTLGQVHKAFAHA
jgi:hypothetical protein